MEVDGFLLRERHRFRGSVVLAFLQPTGLALAYCGKSSDGERLGIDPTPTNAPSNATTSAPTSAPSDYTYSSTSLKRSNISKDCIPVTGNALYFSSSKKEVTGEKKKEEENSLDQVPKPMNIPLAEVWVTAVSECYPGEFPAFSAIHGKQLAEFGKGVLPGYAANILHHTLRNWVLFCNRAASDAAAFKVPSRPTTSFLLKYLKSAVDLWMDKNHLDWQDNKLVPRSYIPKKLANQLKQHALIKNVPTEQPVFIEEKPMTKEELKALMAEDDDSLKPPSKSGAA